MDLCVCAQHSPVWVFEAEPNPTKVVRGRSTAKQIVACFFGKTSHVATVPLEHRRTVHSEWHTTFCLPKVCGVIRKTNKRKRIIHCSPWQWELSHIGSTQRLFGRPKRPIDAVQSWLGTQWLLLIPAWSTIFVARRCCWSVQKTCFGGVLIGVEKQTQMMVVQWCGIK